MPFIDILQDYDRVLSTQRFSWNTFCTLFSRFLEANKKSVAEKYRTYEHHTYKTINGIRYEQGPRNDAWYIHQLGLSDFKFDQLKKVPDYVDPVHVSGNFKEILSSLKIPERPLITINSAAAAVSSLLVTQSPKTQIFADPFVQVSSFTHRLFETHYRKSPQENFVMNSLDVYGVLSFIAMIPGTERLQAQLQYDPHSAFEFLQNAYSQLGNSISTYQAILLPKSLADENLKPKSQGPDIWYV